MLLNSVAILSIEQKYANMSTGKDVDQIVAIFDDKKTEIIFLLTYMFSDLHIID